MKKITLLLLLTLSVLGLQAQTTYQLNYDSIRVNKTAGTGGTSLYGKVYLKNVGLGLVSDSILTVLNGRIRKIPTISQFWQRSGTTLSPTTSGDNVAITVSNANGLIVTNNSATEAAISSRNNGSGNIHQFLNTTGAISAINNNGLLQTASGLSTEFLKANGTVDGTAYLPLTGGTLSGSLSGTSISLTNNISAAGAYIEDANGGFGFTPGGTEIASMEVAVGANGYYDFRRNSVSKWNIGFIGSTRPDSYRINNPTTTATSLEINSATDAASFAGTVSSTPQGTLYGTASGSITSTQLATSLTDETGTGSAVFNSSPSITTPTFATSATINAGTSNINFGATSNYGYASFNGSSSLTGMVGVFGGATGDANTLYHQVPTTGTHVLRVAGTDALLLSETQATFGTVVKDAGVLHAFASKSANYTLTDNDYYITVTADATLTLPSATGRAGKRYVIKAVGAGVDVTISSYTLSGTNENVLILFSDGSNWLTETYISGV